MRQHTKKSSATALHQQPRLISKYNELIHKIHAINRNRVFLSKSGYGIYVLKIDEFHANTRKRTNLQKSYTLNPNVEAQAM